MVRDVALRKETVTSGDRVTKLQNYEDDPVLFECVAGRLRVSHGASCWRGPLTPRCVVGVRVAGTRSCPRFLRW